jgi:hypothetical protein
MTSMRYLFCCTVAGMLLGAVPMSPDLLAQKADLGADMGALNVRHQTEHYAIAGTISDARLMEYGRCLEFIYREYATGFTRLASSPPSNDRSKETSTDKEGDATSSPDAKSDSHGGRFSVIIFSTPAEYDQFAARYLPEQLEHTRGVFLRTLKLLVIRDDPDSAQTYEVLFHEAFHQFANRFMPFIPTWANEGLATYYGHARPTTSGLRFDKSAHSHFQAVQEAKSAKALIPLARLMEMKQAEFYGDERVSNLDLTNRSLCYAQAYTFVSFMLSDQTGAARLRAYLKDLTDAKDSVAEQSITRRHFDAKTLDALTPHWLAYCQKQ